MPTAFRINSPVVEQTFYNGLMRAALTLLLPLVCLAPAGAQTPPSSDARNDRPARQDQRVEHIRHQDAGSRIDEVRIGGETRSITVQPKGNAPAYEVGPESINRNPASADRERGAGGSGGWKIGNF